MGKSKQFKRLKQKNRWLRKDLKARGDWCERLNGIIDKERDVLRDMKTEATYMGGKIAGMEEMASRLFRIALEHEER